MAVAVADKRGLKRICMSCGTRFYDFNKRPVVCPSCSTEFTGEAKAKARRVRSPINDDDGQVAKGIKAGAPDSDEDELDGDVEIVSLSDVEEDGDDKDEDELDALGIDDDDLGALDGLDDNTSLEDELESEEPDAIDDEK